VTEIDAMLWRVRDLTDPAMRAEVDRLDDPLMRHIARYQMGWVDADGEPSDAGGKAVRPAFTVLAAQAVGAEPELAVPAAVAVELVHNFSLLHDDVMDRDISRRHRPTGWVVFGTGQAILAGNAMLTVAFDALTRTGNEHCLPTLFASVQRLISGQSQDLALEERAGVTLDDVITMEAGKTAALLSCATALGGEIARASRESITALAAFGHDVGIAFQLVDDILGITGDPARTGKSASSDVRAGKRSAPIVAALNGDSSAATRLADMFAGGPPKTDEDVELATKLIGEAGGLDWAAREADSRLSSALSHLDTLASDGAPAVTELAGLARYVVDRDR
jgi:geranylgeranyl diphosphate synthase, type I